ncbi:carbohydrate ABC transporter permease [Roseibium limicola]|nr:ABC transporter permease subunit [Roseibium limicola]
MTRQNLVDHTILIAGSLIMCVPLCMVFLATTHEAGTPGSSGLTLVPGSHFLENYRDMLTLKAGFGGDITALGMIWNSFLLATGFAAVKVSFSLAAAYGLSYFRVPAAGFIFWLLLLSLMLPLESRFLPTFDVLTHFGLVDTTAGLVLPLAASGLGTIFFLQFLKTLPETLVEAARLDGAGPFRFFRDILVPLSAPMAGALFLVLFVTGWNQYLWPVLVTSSEDGYTLVRGLQYFGNGSLYGKMLACLAVLPPALLILVFQRQFVKGLFDGSH